MSHRVAIAITLLVVFTLPRAPLESSQATGATRTVLVTVVGDKGMAVLDLTSADFVIKEDGKVRDVVAASLAKEPLHVALLVDDNGFGLGAIRQGLVDFITRLRGTAQFSLTTTSGRNIKVLDYTADPQVLRDAINKLYARSQKGGYLLDGLMEAASDVRTREFARAAILAVTTEAEEFSNIRPEPVLEAIQASRASVYLVNLGPPAMGAMNPASANKGESLLDESGTRNAVFGAAPARSGGRAEQVIANTGIPKVMAQMAEELAGQYSVTYRLPETSAGEAKLSVEVRRKGAKARAPQRVGSR